MKLDILAFGAHPDDIELCCSGTIFRQISLGYSVGIIDLTRGELGTRGTAEIRMKEAEAASEIMGIKTRVNLGLDDGFFRNDKESQIKIIEQIRRFKPDIILTNAIKDRHIDHGRGSELVSDAAFLAGLVKIETEWEGQKQEVHRPKAVYHYLQDRYIQPDLVVDITEFMDQKMKAILAYRSQFHHPEEKKDAPQTPISSPDFLESVKSRAREVGRPIGVRYGEGFTTERYIGVKDLMDLL